jgi:hypothetical protein
MGIWRRRIASFAILSTTLGMPFAIFWQWYIDVPA